MMLWEPQAITVPASTASNMSQLATNTVGSQYSDQDRLQAATEYAIHGSIIKASEYTNIPSRTLYDWSKAEWWESEIIRIREENKEIIRAGITRIVEKGFNNIEDRIENGDAYITKEKNKDGDIVDVIKRKPASLRDLGTVTGIAFDKLRLLNNEPTSITDNSSGKLQELLAQFEAISHAKVIDGQVIDSKDDPQTPPED